MTPDTFTVTDVCKATGVDESTLRRWLPMFAESLSAGANPPPGATRRFTGRDVRVIALAQRLRSEGLGPSAVAARLRDATETDLPDLERLTALAGVSTAAPETVRTRSMVLKGASSDVKAIASATEAIARNLGALSETNAQLAELRASIDTLSQRVAALEHVIESLPWPIRRKKA